MLVKLTPGQLVDLAGSGGDVVLWHDVDVEVGLVTIVAQGVDGRDLTNFRWFPKSFLQDVHKKLGQNFSKINVLIMKKALLKSLANIS